MLGDFAGVNLGKPLVIVDKMAVCIAVALPHGRFIVADAVKDCTEHTVVDFAVLIQHGIETIFQWDCPWDRIAIFVFVVLDDAVLRPTPCPRTVVVTGANDVTFGKVRVALHFFDAVEPKGSVTAPLPSCVAPSSLCAEQTLFFDDMEDLELECGEVIATQYAAIVEFDEAAGGCFAVDFDGLMTCGVTQEDDLCSLYAIIDVVGEFHIVDGNVDEFFGEVLKRNGVFLLPTCVFDADFVFHRFSFISWVSHSLR